MKSRIGRALRATLERIIGRYYEGPEPPPRLAEEVVLFRAYNPHASQDAWAEFALRFARNAYRDGFVRGLEWQQRGWLEQQAESEEQRAERARHDWQLERTNAAFAALKRAGQDPRDPAFGLNPKAQQQYYQLVEHQLRADAIAYNELEEQKRRSKKK